MSPSARPLLPLLITLVATGSLLTCPSVARTQSQSQSQTRADVLVYGGSASGIVAAVQAARMGKQVVVVEPGRFIGGLTAGGLGMTDTGHSGTIGGVSREFYQRIYRYYTRPEAWKYDRREDYLAWLPWKHQGKHPDETKIQFLFEPSAATKVFHEMLDEAGVRLVLDERLDRNDGVRKERGRIVSIRMESGNTFAARVFIDATYEGDLMATAGVTHTYGRESNAQYGETLNGILPSGPLVFSKFDAYVVPGDPSSGLLPRVEPVPPGPPGAADTRQQAYNFRLCLTNEPDNRVPFTKPADYNPLDYELLARWIRTLSSVKPGPSRIGRVALMGENRNLVFSFHAVPNGKTDSNTGSEFGSDYLGRSWEWANGSYARRAELWQEHKNYIRGLLWFLSHDERCPEPVRQEMQKWGLAKDEFVENDHWPFQLYVREARRMVSDYVMSEHDARNARFADDSIALGSYHSDSHGVTLYLDGQGRLCREKGFYVRTGIFPISYRSIRPRRGEGSNLLVPMCLSSTHACYGPLRMEPVFMMLGQAAGTAASLAIDAEVSVQDLPYPMLRQRLLSDGAILEWDATTKPTTRARDSRE